MAAKKKPAAAKRSPAKSPKSSKASPMAKVREAALAYPGVTEEFPWGERVIKVKGKVFVFLGRDAPGADVGFAVKLPHSGDAALSLPFCTPTGYGLGKSGWVSATFPGGKNIPLPLLLEWLDESYRAVAPKKLLALLPSKERVPA